jgi:hypothetical protein
MSSDQTSSCGQPETVEPSTPKSDHKPFSDGASDGPQSSLPNTPTVQSFQAGCESNEFDGADVNRRDFPAGHQETSVEPCQCPALETKTRHAVGPTNGVLSSQKPVLETDALVISMDVIETVLDDFLARVARSDSDLYESAGEDLDDGSRTPTRAEADVCEPAAAPDSADNGASSHAASMAAAILEKVALTTQSAPPSADTPASEGNPAGDEVVVDDAVETQSEVSTESLPVPGTGLFYLFLVFTSVLRSRREVYIRLALFLFILDNFLLRKIRSNDSA